jgi:hypothetical protein
MKIISQYLPKTFGEVLMFSLIMTALFIAPVAYLKHLDAQEQALSNKRIQISKYEQEFINKNPKMKQVIHELDECMFVDNQGKHKAKAGCIEKVMESMDQEEVNKFLNYSEKRQKLGKELIALLD